MSIGEYDHWHLNIGGWPIKEQGAEMGFNWFWDRVGEKWIISVRAAYMFGLATVFICFLTAFWLGAIKFHETGAAGNLAWGALAILSILSIPFLWGGMRKYQKMRDRAIAKGSKAIRLAMMIGVWYTAIIYFLLVYLPTRGDELRSAG